MTAALEQGSESGRTRSVGGLLSPHSSLRPHVRASEEDQETGEGSCASQPTPKTYKAPSRNTMISLAVIDEYSFTRETITRSLQETCKHLSIVSFETSDQCLGSTKNYDVILYHKHWSSASHNSSDTKLADIKKLSSTAPVILLCDTESFELLRAVFDCGVRGYIPTASTNIEVTIKIIYLVKAGGIFVPPSSLSPRRINLPATHNLVTTQKFTPRQMAVLERLKLGQTNKIIAFELNMSASSVKTHIQNIMKKMNATNRTEVACLAQKLEINGARFME